MLTPGEVRVVYFSAGGKDILGRSGLLSVRSDKSDINISHSSQILISNISLRRREFTPPPQTEQAREAVEEEL